MSRQIRIEYAGAYYHVTSRGNDRRKIFDDAKDREAFKEKLERSQDIYNVVLLGYVCMTNHFHLLVQTPQANLSEFMRHFNISYTSAFNRRHKRSGHLYQGRFKAFLIEADSYLLAVSRYIHLNPIRTRGSRGKTAQEKWQQLMENKNSSLPGFLSVKERKGFVDYKAVLDYMGGDTVRGRREYSRFVRAGVDGEIENPLMLGKGSGIVGGVSFIDTIKRRFLKGEEGEREQPELRELRKELEPEELVKKFCRLTKTTSEEVSRRGGGIKRAMLMEILYRYGRLTQPEIGSMLGGIDYSAVSQARKRFQAKMARDSGLKTEYQRITGGLSIIKI